MQTLSQVEMMIEVKSKNPTLSCLALCTETSQEQQYIGQTNFVTHLNCKMNYEHEDKYNVYEN